MKKLINQFYERPLLTSFIISQFFMLALLFIIFSLTSTSIKKLREDTITFSTRLFELDSPKESFQRFLLLKENLSIFKFNVVLVSDQYSVISSEFNNHKTQELLSILKKNTPQQDRQIILNIIPDKNIYLVKLSNQNYLIALVPKRGALKRIIPLIFIASIISALLSSLTITAFFYFYVLKRSNEAKKLLNDLSNKKPVTWLKEADRDYLSVVNNLFNKYAKQLIKKNKINETLLIEKEMFAQEVSHDLSTPLTSIRIGVDYLYEKTLDNQDKEFLTIMRSETYFMESLIEDLIMYSSIESDFLQNDTFEIDIVKTIKKITYDLSLAIDPKEIKINFTHDNLVKVNGNHKLIERALRNIIENAIKYCESQISIQLINLDNEIQISVENDGTLITNQEISQYGKLNNKRKKYIHGPNGSPSIGIGSVISSKIIELHQGEITLYQNDQQLTVVRVTFPHS